MSEATTKQDIDEVIGILHSFMKQVDERFNAVDEQFTSIDKRFNSLETGFEARFNRIEARFDEHDEQFRQLNAKYDHLINILSTASWNVLINTKPKWLHEITNLRNY